METASSATSAGADDKADIAQATQAKGVGTPATASAPQPGAAGPKTVAAAKPAARVNASASKSKAPGKTVGTSSAVKSKKPKKSVPGGGSRTKKRAHTGGFDGLMSAANRLLENGRAREARAKFLAASRKRPSSPEPLANLGWCELELRRTGKAISFFKKALGRNPRYADALYGLGVAHERNQDPARAKKAYQTYLAVNPRGSKIRMVKRRLDRLR